MGVRSIQKHYKLARSAIHLIRLYWESQMLLYDNFKATGSKDAGKKLSFDRNRKANWEEKMDPLIFAKSNRKTWRRLNEKSQVTADQIASQLVENSKGEMTIEKGQTVKKETQRTTSI